MSVPTLDPQGPARPWWRHGLVWLLLSGPIAVVIASGFTFWLAAHGADLLVEDGASRTAIQRQLARDRALLPALQGRNHAVTPAGGER